MKKKNIKIKLSVLREAKGMSQRDLAREAGVSPSAITSYESGTRIPRVDSALAIAKVLSTEVSLIQFGR